VFRNLISLLGSGFVVLLLSACASVSKLPTGLYSQSERHYLYDIRRWNLDGRVAITSSKDSWSAHIEWNHRPNSEAIKLSGPLGQGAIVIELADGIVKIDRGNGNIQTSNQPEQFINQQLGLFVPLQSLRYWAVGLPEPDQDFQETVDGFVQDEWLIAYKEQQKTNIGAMPHKMSVSNEQVKLKLIVDQWELNDGKTN
jgi:outer membrane lipoprotein LolB